MSATIPNRMLLSDLLKTTGYDCPDDLQGKTFNQAISGGGGEADLEANHASSVNVEEYTQPIEITPAEGKDGMEKVTLTLTNIPSEADIEANKKATINVSTYTEPVEITPTAGKDGMAKATVTLSNIPSSKPLYIYHYEQGGDSLLCEASSFENITVGMKGVLSSGASEYMTGATCTKKTDESATFRNDTYSITIASSDVPTALDSILN